MIKLSELLEVNENEEFEIKGGALSYKIENNILMSRLVSYNPKWEKCSMPLNDLIEFKEKIIRENIYVTLSFPNNIPINSLVLLSDDKLKWYTYHFRGYQHTYGRFYGAHNETSSPLYSYKYLKLRVQQ